MFPDLLTYAPALTAEFHLSLPQDLMTSLSLLRLADSFEGLSDWVYRTAAALPDDFKAELDRLAYPIKWCFRRQDSLIWRLPPAHPAHEGWDAFRSHLQSVPATEFQRVLLLNLSNDAGQPVPPALPDEAELGRLLDLVRRLEVEKWGQTSRSFLDPGPFVTLARVPNELKARLIGLLARFWEGYYRQDFAHHRQSLRHSVAHHRRQIYPRGFVELFRQVTGRAPSATVRDYVQAHLDQIERVIFAPCVHLGLYFQITLSYPSLVVAFNYRTTPVQEVEDGAVVELFPPLKALADESRLHILALLQEGEMYAQQIVEAIGLSQSTVSRHLQLLERTEIVTARQDKGMKFYAINRDRGGDILAVLHRLIG